MGNSSRSRLPALTAPPDVLGCRPQGRRAPKELTIEANHLGAEEEDVKGEEVSLGRHQGAFLVAMANTTDPTAQAIHGSNPQVGARLPHKPMPAL